MKIGIIGGGAAGFFAAINAAEKNPKAEIYILEKSTKLLSKVKISGGGRCNVTNAIYENYHLIKNYPRGGKELRKAFDLFSVKDTLSWFSKRGVKLKTEEDGRIFPATDDSQTIIDCFLNEAKRLRIKILKEHGVKEIVLPSEKNKSFILRLFSGGELTFDKILISTGGNPKEEGYQWIADKGIKIIPPVPSLFTFNLPQTKFKDLQGIAVNETNLKITGIKNEQQGPMLVTHWGLSGPAVLRLSAWEARTLSEMNYTFTALINFAPGNPEESLRELFRNMKSEQGKKMVMANPLFSLPRRLWERIVTLAEIPDGLKWADVPQKNINKLIEELIRCPVQVKGKTTFKEEFVTCGGVALENINLQTMESKIIPGMYFAGEVLDIDGITGGFNFQAAWTTGYIAGTAMAV